MDVASPNFQPVETKYEVKLKQENGHMKAVKPTAESLMEKYWSYDIVAHIVSCSNAYIARRKRKEPDLYLWKEKNEKLSRPITVSEIYHFLAIMYYFGIVRLPSKRDYWSKHPILPTHSIMTELGMNRPRFEFIFRHFHVNTVTDDEVHAAADESEDDIERDNEGSRERVQHEQDNEQEDTHLDNY